MELPPAILIVFGATGDLFRKKIIPAAYLLSTDGRAGEKFKVVGFGRRDLTDEAFRERIAESLRKTGLEPDENKVMAFAGRFSYVQGNFEDPDAFLRLKRELDIIDSSWNLCSAKSFYLAVPPELFAGILGKLKGAGLEEGCGPQNPARVLIEKPFGANLETAQELNRSIREFFEESSISRIEHYLAKDTLRALPRVRNESQELQRLLMREHIDRIEVRLHETIGVEDRGAFYDKVGAWQDVGENHLLEMLALALMDPPQGSSASALRAARATFIGSLPRLTDDAIAHGAVRAQYEGYQDIAGVAPGSATETYFKLSFELAGAYAGVPVTLESGKRFNVARKGVEISFKPGTGYARLLISLEPRMEIVLERLGGERIVLFENPHAAHIQYAGQYATLIADALKGEQAWFVSEEEVEAEWRFADPITNAFARDIVPLGAYAPAAPQGTIAI